MIDFNCGQGVFLSTLDSSHLDTIRNARNEYSVWKWCRQPTLIPEASHKAWFEWQAKDPNTKMYAVKAPSFDIIGVCGFTGIDWVNRRAEFSLYISPMYQRRGFARAALKTLFSHGFQDLNLNLIWGETFEGNPAFDLFTSLGMVHEGTRRDFYFKDGKYLSAKLVSLRSSEWNAPQR